MTIAVIGHINNEFSELEKLLNFYRDKTNVRTYIFLGGFPRENDIDSVVKIIKTNQETYASNLYLLSGSDSPEIKKRLNTFGFRDLSSRYEYSSECGNIIGVEGSEGSETIPLPSDPDKVVSIVEETKKPTSTYKVAIKTFVVNNPIFGLPFRDQGNIGLNQVIHKNFEKISGLILSSGEKIMKKEFSTEEESSHSYISVPPLSIPTVCMIPQVPYNESFLNHILIKPYSAAFAEAELQPCFKRGLYGIR